MIDASAAVTTETRTTMMDGELDRLARRYALAADAWVADVGHPKHYGRNPPGAFHSATWAAYRDAHDALAAALGSAGEARYDNRTYRLDPKSGRVVTYFFATLESVTTPGHA
jgi:hypothetical protein